MNGFLHTLLARQNFEQIAPTALRSGARETPVCATVGPGSRAVVRLEEIHLWVNPQRSEIPAIPNRGMLPIRVSDFGAVLSHCGDCSPYFVVPKSTKT